MVSDDVPDKISVSYKLPADKVQEGVTLVGAGFLVLQPLVKWLARHRLSHDQRGCDPNICWLQKDVKTCHHWLNSLDKNESLQSTSKSSGFKPLKIALVVPEFQQSLSDRRQNKISLNCFDFVPCDLDWASNETSMSLIFLFFGGQQKWQDLFTIQRCHCGSPYDGQIQKVLGNRWFQGIEGFKQYSETKKTTGKHWKTWCKHHWSTRYIQVTARDRTNKKCNKGW